MEKFNSNLSVLIVDDVKAPRRVLKRLLSEIGLTKVEEAETGKAALSCTANYMI